MASDRGTLPRGTAPGADQPPGWQDPISPSARRLPGPRRERKPALAALALLLIVGGALGAGFLVIQSGRRVDAIEISHQIGAGERIPADALTEVAIAATSGLHYVPWSEASQVVRYYAGTSIPAGTLLTNAMVVSANTAAAGKAVVGLALKDGQYPDGLQVGDHVNLYQANDGGSGGCPGGAGRSLASDAVVLSITAPSSSGGGSATDVQVAIPPSDAGPVTCNAANGFVAVAKVPNRSVAAAGTTHPAQSPSSGSAPSSSGSSPSGTTPAGPGLNPSPSATG